MGLANMHVVFLIVAALAQRAASVTTSCAIDFCLALDQSSSIDDSEYANITDFVDTFVGLIASSESSFISPGTGSVVGFSNTATVLAGATSDTSSITAAAAGDKRGVRGSTALYDGVGKCIDNLNSSSGIPKVILVLGDGEDNASSRYTSATAVHDAAAAAGIDVFAVQIDVSTNSGNFPALVGNKAGNLFSSSFDALGAVASSFAEAMCMVIDEPQDPLDPPQDPASCGEAAAACDFFFEGSEGDVPFYDICAMPTDGPGFSDVIKARNGDEVNVLNSNGPVDEFLAVDSTFAPLVELNDALTPFQFKPFSQPAPRIGHETFQRESLPSVWDQCIRIFFSSWQILDAPGGNVQSNVNLNTGDAQQATSCVVFRTTAAPSCARRQLKQLL